MNDADLACAVDLLEKARIERVAIDPLTGEWPQLSVPDAYRVLDAVLARRTTSGERTIGIKLGLTSRAKQAAMSIAQPTVGWLTDRMVVSGDEPLSLSDYIHPRAEPEIAFVTDRDLRGPVTAAEALAAVRSVHAAIEVIDSRYTNFRFRLEDTIADNSSAASFVIHPNGLRVNDVDLLFEAVRLEESGVVVDSATGAAVYGHPAAALAWAVNTLAERGKELPAGSVVLTGGMTDAIALRAGVSVGAQFSHLGHLMCRAVEGEER